MSFAIITDSASNLNEELLEKYNIDMVSFNYLIDDKIYPCFVKGMDYESVAKKYYQLIREGKFIKTSLISPQDYIECFKKHLDKGEDILYISISAGLSGTYNSSCNARDMLLDEYKDRKIICLDSMSASFGEGINAINASKLRAEGKTLEETVKIISDNRLFVRNEFTVDNLIYLKRTGRISALVYSIGALLDIKPLLRASRDAKIESCGKVRGRKKALLTMLNTIKNNIVNPEEQTIYIAHCDCKDEVLKFATLLKENIPVKDVYTEYYDLCTGSHVGPGTIAIFYEGKERQ